MSNGNGVSHTGGKDVNVKMPYVDPRGSQADQMKQMLMNLDQWLGMVGEEAVVAMEGSQLVAHHSAVGFWLTQLQAFGSMLQPSLVEAHERVRSLVVAVGAASARLNGELDLRLPRRV